MRITELLESNDFNDLAFIKHTADGREIDFDIPEDLIFFMHDDDDTYRKQLHPIITKCIDLISANRKTNHSFFEPAVKNSYYAYIKKFPIRELPDELESSMVSDICKKIHDDVCKHISSGKYED